MIMKKFLLSCFGVLVAMMLIGCVKNDNPKNDNPEYDYLVLVNKQHKLPADWEANVQLVEVQK